MRISVVIPTYDREAQIAGSVLSVARQTLPPDEIIVVDDGSRDRTREVLEDLNLPNLRYIRQQNAGGNIARNRGVEAARNPWIAFHDSDDYWLPHKLETVRQAVARQGGDGPEVIFSAFLLYDPVKRRARIMPAALAGVRDSVVRYDDPIRQTRALVANPISTQTLVVSKDLLQRVGGFDVNLRRFQDWDLAIRLAAASSFLFLSEPLCYVAISSDSITRQYEAGLAARRRLLEKHEALYLRHGADRRRARLDLCLRRLARHFV